MGEQLVGRDIQVLWAAVMENQALTPSPVKTQPQKSCTVGPDKSLLLPHVTTSGDLPKDVLI